MRGHTFYVADAAGNDLVQITNGVASLGAVLSTTGQPVPTSLAWGPEGDLYIGTLNFEGGPGAATVYRFDPRTHDLSVYATGLTAITSLAFGPGGELFVTEWTTGFGPNGPSPDGDVVAKRACGDREGGLRSWHATADRADRAGRFRRGSRFLFDASSRNLIRCSRT